MKRTLIIMTIIMFIITFTASADTVNTKETPWPLWIAEYLINFTNETFDYYHKGFMKEINELFDGIQDYLIDTGKILVGFVTVVTIVSKIDNFEQFTFITIAPAFVFFGVGLIVIENIDLIFGAFRELANDLSGSIGLSEGGFISFEVIRNSFDQALAQAGHRITQLLIGALNAVIYTLIGLVSLFAFIIALAATLVVEIKIGLYKIVAPVMLAGFGSPLTSSMSFGFLQGVLKSHLELFYIQVVIAIFTALMSKPGNAFVMTLIGLIGLIIALLGGGRMVFNFLANRG